MAGTLDLGEDPDTFLIEGGHRFGDGVFVRGIEDGVLERSSTSQLALPVMVKIFSSCAMAWMDAGNVYEAGARG